MSEDGFDSDGLGENTIALSQLASGGARTYHEP
jgi:hypothetical protein